MNCGNKSTANVVNPVLFEQAARQVREDQTNIVPGSVRSYGTTVKDASDSR